MRLPDADEVAGFEARGYLRLPELVDSSTLALLREAYDELLEHGAKASRDAYLGGLTRQIVLPEQSHPVFRANAALDAGRSIARLLRDWTEPEFFYSQLIYKPPGHPHATPWHQDDAYGAKPFVPAGTALRRASLQFWLALDDVDVENGCMHFHPAPPGYGLLPHRVAAGEPQDDARLLALEDEERWLDTAQIEACPLSAGGATVHDSATLHFTPANVSARPRRAYIFNFADPRFVAAFRAAS